MPEMLKGSAAFEARGGGSVFDGCFADTAEIGYLVSSDVFIVNSGFYNNPLMGLKSSVAIKHERGTLKITGCHFRSSVITDTLYDGTGKELDARSCIVSLKGIDAPEAFKE